MSRILAIDFGDRRVGIAISDTMRIIGQPLTTINRDDNAKWWRELLDIVVDKEVGEIVVGYPLTMKGTVSAQTETVQRFIDELKERVDVPVLKYDERLTSVAAKRVLHEKGVKTGHNKGAVDRTAAAILLQDYLGFSQ